MHPVLREADEVIEGGAPIASDIDVRHGYDLRTDRHRFRLAAYAFRGEFRVDHFAMMQLTPATRSNLANIIRSMWRAMTAERMRTALAPPRLTVAQGVQIAAEWGRYDGMIFRDFPEPTELFGEPANRAMASNQAPEPAPALTMETMRQAIQMMQEANAEQRYQRERAIWPGDRCPCPACRESRSVALLKEWLSPEQLAQYEREQCFEVTGSAGTRYAIHRGISGNVYEMAAGRVIRSWCFGPEGEAGRWTGDVMLAQKLALETDEEGVLAVANRVSGPPRAGERARPMPPPLNLFGQMMGPGGLF